MCSCKHLYFINLTKDLYSSSSVALNICCQADCQSWLLTAAYWCLTCLLSETHSLICVTLFYSETGILFSSVWAGAAFQLLEAGTALAKLEDFSH